MGSVSGVAQLVRRAAPRAVRPLVRRARRLQHARRSRPSGNLHGMALALLCGEDEFDDAFGGSWRGRGRPRATSRCSAPARSMRASARCSRSAASRSSTCARIDEQGATIPIQRLIERVQEADGHLHLSLDVDAMDPSIAPGRRHDRARRPHLSRGASRHGDAARRRDRRLARHRRAQPVPRSRGQERRCCWSISRRACSAGRSSAATRRRLATARRAGTERVATFRRPQKQRPARNAGRVPISGRR